MKILQINQHIGVECRVSKKVAVQLPLNKEGLYFQVLLSFEIQDYQFL